jgi:hexosaminidase
MTTRRTQRRGLFTPFLAFSCLFHFASALWPMPRSFQTGTTLLKLASNFDIKVSDIPQAPQDLNDAISRTMSRLHTDQLQRLIVGRGANDSAALTHAPSLAGLTLALTPNSPPIKSIMEETTKEITERSESYSLTIPDKDQGVATLTANSSLGLLRGMATFEQLWYQVSGTVYSYQAPVEITNDSPAYVRVPIMCLPRL